MATFSLSPRMIDLREKILNGSLPESARRIALLALINALKDEIHSRDDTIKDKDYVIEKRDEVIAREVQRNMDLELKRILASEGLA